MKFLARLDSFVMPSKSKKNASPAAGEEREIASPDDVGRGAGQLADDLRPGPLGRVGLSACRRIDVDVCRPSPASRRSAGAAFAWIVGHRSSPLGLAHALTSRFPGPLHLDVYALIVTSNSARFKAAGQSPRLS